VDQSPLFKFSIRRRLGRNSLWKLAGDGSRFLLALFLLLVARHYGPTRFGAFSLLYAAGIFFSIVADFGLNLLTTRQIAAHKADPGRFLRTFFSCKLLLLPFWILVPAGLCRLAPQPGVPTRLVLLLAASFAARNMLEFFGAVFSGFEKIQYEAALKLAAHLILLVGGFWAMAHGRSLSFLAATMLAGYLVAALVGGVWCHAMHGLFPLRAEPSTISVVYAEAFPLILMGAGLATLTKWNTLLLGFLGVAYDQIGWFSAAEKVVSALAALPMLVTAASYPVLSDLHKNAPERFPAAQAWLVRAFIAVGLVTASVIVAVSGALVHRLYGPGYAGARVSLCLLAVGIIASFPNHMLLNVLVASGRSAEGAWAALAACVANVVLTLILIPIWGVAGSALASSLAQFVLFCAAFILNQRASPRGALESVAR
jgi:O-antigen/teichoic acid export membrane protein